MPFLYLLMVTGLRLAHGIRLLESGMPIVPHCSVSCVAMGQLCPLISVVVGIIWQSQMGGGGVTIWNYENL